MSAADAACGEARVRCASEPTNGPQEADLEEDGVGDACDDCPTVENADQDPSACECRCLTTEDIDAHGAGVVECGERVFVFDDIPELTTYVTLTDGSRFSSAWAEFPGVPELTYGNCRSPSGSWESFHGYGNGTIGRACAAEIKASQAWITNGCPVD